MTFFCIFGRKISFPSGLYLFITNENLTSQNLSCANRDHLPPVLVKPPRPNRIQHKRRLVGHAKFFVDGVQVVRDGAQLNAGCGGDFLMLGVAGANCLHDTHFGGGEWFVAGTELTRRDGHKLPPFITLTLSPRAFAHCGLLRAPCWTHVSTRCVALV